MANHGTVTFGPDLEKAYWNSEIIDAYCKILLLARQLGPVNYLNKQHAQDLLAFRKRLGYDDPRYEWENCDLCANNAVGRGYSETASPVAASRSPLDRICRRHRRDSTPRSRACSRRPLRSGSGAVHPSSRLAAARG